VVSADNEVAGCYIGEQLVQGRAAGEVVAGDAVIDAVLRALPEDGRLSMTKSLSETERALALGIDAEVLPFFLGPTQENPKRRSARHHLEPAGAGGRSACLRHGRTLPESSVRISPLREVRAGSEQRGPWPEHQPHSLSFRSRAPGCKATPARLLLVRSFCWRRRSAAQMRRARVRRRSRTIDEVRAQEAAYQHPHDQTLRQVRFERLGDRSPGEDLHPYDDRGSDHTEAVPGQRTKGDFGSGKVGNHRCVGLSASRHRKTRTNRTLRRRQPRPSVRLSNISGLPNRR
jgi:hypothetical protein